MAVRNNKQSVANNKQVWEKTSLPQWEMFLRTYAPNNGWTLKGQSISGRCVYHTDHTPSMLVSPKRRLVKCFACGHVESDPVRFIAKVAKSTLADAVANHLPASFDVRLSRQASEDTAKYTRRQRAFQAIAQAMRLTLINASTSYYDEAFAYCQAAVVTLVKRGVPFSIEHYHALPVGIVPTKRHLRQFIPDNTLFSDAVSILDNFYGRDPDALGPGIGDISFFYYNSFDDIGGIKLRNPRKKNFRWVSFGDDVPRGLFGLNRVRATLTQDSGPTRLYVVEGEFDALQFDNIWGGAPPKIGVVAASGGGADTDLSYVESLGVDDLSIVGDNDLGGTSFACGILSGYAGAVSIFTWPQTVQGADPDEALQAPTANAFLEALYAKTDWSGRDQWFVENVLHRIRALSENSSAEIGSIHETAIESMIPAIANGLSASSRQSIVQDLIRNGVHAATINLALARHTNQGSLVHTFRHALEAHLLPVFRNDDETVSFYSRRLNELVDVPVEDSARRVAARVLPHIIDGPHMTAVEWANTYVGLPPEVVYGRSAVSSDSKKEPTPRSELDMERDVQEYLRLALLNMSQVARRARNMLRRGKGAHYVGHRNDYTDLADRVYVVNGAEVFKGRIPRDLQSPEPVQFELLEVPFEDRLMFDNTQDRWSRYISGVDSLNTPVGMSPRVLFKHIYDMIHSNWSFSGTNTQFSRHVNQLESMYLTAFVLAASVGSLFRRRCQTYVTAERHSGKTELLMQLLSNEGNIGLLENSEFVDNYTAAGVRQRITDRVPGLLIDEFEAASITGANMHKATHTNQILEELRGNIKGMSRTLRGTPDQRAVVREVSAMCLFAGIYPPMRDGADISRWIMVSLQHDKRRLSSPSDSIIKKHQANGTIDHVRKAVTLLPLQYAHHILFHEDHVINNRVSYATPARNEAKSRYTDLMSPIYTILRWVGIDDVKFAKQYARIKAVNNDYVEENEQLLDDILSTMLPLSPMQAADPEHPRTISQYLSTADNREMLNRDQIGVYYEPESDCVIMYLPHVMQNILKHNEAYAVTKGARNTAVLQRKLQSRGALKDGIVRGLGLDAWINALYNKRVHPTQIAVFPRDSLDYFEEVFGSETGSVQNLSPSALRTVIDQRQKSKIADSDAESDKQYSSPQDIMRATEDLEEFEL